MERKPSSLRMLESLFECEQPYVERNDVWQRESQHSERGVRRPERKRTGQRLSPKVSPQDSA